MAVDIRLEPPSLVRRKSPFIAALLQFLPPLLIAGSVPLMLVLSILVLAVGSVLPSELIALMTTPVFIVLELVLGILYLVCSLDSWGVGYLYLGRRRRFAIVWTALSSITAVSCILLIYSIANTGRNGSHTGDEALALPFFYYLVIGPLSTIISSILAIDAWHLARAYNRQFELFTMASLPPPAAAPERKRAEQAALPPPAATGDSIDRAIGLRYRRQTRTSPVRSPAELRCVVEAAGLAPDAIPLSFWQSLRPDWLTGDQTVQPFDDPAMNAVYAELLALRHEQPLRAS